MTLLQGWPLGGGTCDLRIAPVRIVADAIFCDAVCSGRLACIPDEQGIQYKLGVINT